MWLAAGRFSQVGWVGDLLVSTRFRRVPFPHLILRWPYLEILRNQRLRHTQGIRQTRCLHAGRQYVPWDVCRRSPWICDYSWILVLFPPIVATFTPFSSLIFVKRDTLVIFIAFRFMR